MDNHPSIDLQELYGALDNELDDLYTDGVISASIYNKKAAKRMMLYAISRADRHIAAQIKLSANVAVYVPADQRTIFFARQGQYISEWLDAHSDEETADPLQFSLLIDEKAFLDVLSVLSNYAHAYATLPVSEAADASDVLIHSMPGQTEHLPDRKYMVTGGEVLSERPSGRRFYVEPNSRKMVLSKSFGSAMWIRFLAQISPVAVGITELSKGELDQYKIRCPYWTREWMLYRSIINLVPKRAAAEYGFFDLEAKSRIEAFENQPGTGNVIISGDELDGNYEGDFNF